MSDTPIMDAVDAKCDNLCILDRVGYAVCEGKELEEKLNAANQRIKLLEREVKTLRLYGNKDCTAQADEVLKEQAKPGESAIECLTSSTATKIDVALLDVEFEWKEAE